VEAFAKGSKAAIAHYERILAEEAIISENGRQSLTKAAFLGRAKSGIRESAVLEKTDVKTLLYGDTVIVTGFMLIKSASSGMRYTHVYVKREGQWQIVAVQYTPIIPQ